MNKYFQFYNANPKEQITEDCVIRALTKFLNKPYDTILNDLIEIYRHTGFHIADPVCFMTYLSNYSNIQKYDVSFVGNVKLIELCEFIETQNNNGKILNITQNHNEFKHITHKNSDKVLVLLENTHLTFVENSVIIDIWDCSDLNIVSYFVWKD